MKSPLTLDAMRQWLSCHDKPTEQGRNHEEGRAHEYVPYRLKIPSRDDVDNPVHHDTILSQWREDAEKVQIIAAQKELS